MGNLRSVSQAVLHVAQGSGVDAIVTSRPEDVRAAERVVLPGQGAMPDCMRELRESGLLESVLEAAASKPLFGVCVGMQMLLDRSEEGPTDGLGLIHGEVVRSGWKASASPMAAATRCRKWAGTGCTRRAHPMWEGVPDESWFYFVHSFYARPSDPRHSVGESEYGVRFTCAVARDNIFATQFHPEKSADQGLTLYRNFLHWTP